VHSFPVTVFACALIPCECVCTRSLCVCVCVHSFLWLLVRGAGHMRRHFDERKAGRVIKKEFVFPPHQNAGWPEQHIYIYER